MIRIKQKFMVTLTVADVLGECTESVQELHDRLDQRIASDIREILEQEYGSAGTGVVVEPATELEIVDIQPETTEKASE